MNKYTIKAIAKKPKTSKIGTSQGILLSIAEKEGWLNINIPPETELNNYDHIKRGKEIYIDGVLDFRDNSMLINDSNYIHISKISATPDDFNFGANVEKEIIKELNKEDREKSSQEPIKVSIFETVVFRYLDKIKELELPAEALGTMAGSYQNCIRDLLR